MKNLSNWSQNNLTFTRMIIVISYWCFLTLFFTTNISGSDIMPQQNLTNISEIKNPEKKSNRESRVVIRSIGRDTSSNPKEVRLNVEDGNALKKDPQVGNGKKVVEKILLLLVASFFFTGTVSVILGTPALIDVYDGSGIGFVIAVLIGVSVLSTILTVLAVKRLIRLWKPKNPHLRQNKPKSKKSKITPDN